MTQIWTAQSTTLVRRGYSDNFILGVTKPTTSNTGVPAGTNLTTVNGDIVVTAAGTLVENKEVIGFIKVKAANVTIRNCYVRGRSTAVDSSGYVQAGIIDCSDAAASATIIERCTIKCDYPRYWQNGIHGKSFTAIRCNISQSTDGMQVSGSNWAAEGCYIHDLAFHDGIDPNTGLVSSSYSDHATDSRFPGYTHNDGVQVMSGNNGRIEGCTIEGYFSATVGTPSTAINNPAGYASGRIFPKRNHANCIIITPRSGYVTNMQIINNWIEGGENCMQMTTGGTYDTANSVTVSGNRLGLDQKPGYTGNPINPYNVISYTISGTITVSQTTNVYDDLPSVPAGLVGTSIGAPIIQSGETLWKINK